MKKWFFLFMVLVGLLAFVGCYTPEGGSSIPWNEPTPGDGSFTPRMNF